MEIKDQEKITPKKAIKYIKLFQKWRRGEEIDGFDPDPTTVGCCLDMVLEYADRAVSDLETTKP